MSTYDEVADAAQRGRLRPVEGTRTTGREAADAAAADLLAATGAEDLDQGVELALGRPRVGEERGPSPMWRVRAPQDLDDAVRALADQRGQTVSMIVRQAVRDYLTATSNT